jgi:hypothetical protein
MKMRPSIPKDAPGITLLFSYLPAFGRMRLPVHFDGQHPQMVYGQKVFMLTRTMF